MNNDVVEPVEESAGELVPVPKGRLLEVLAGEVDIEYIAADAAEIGRRMAKEAQSIESEEDLWKEVPTWGTKSNVGFEFEIRGLRGVYPSKFAKDDGSEQGQFVAWEAVNLVSGELGILNTSAMRINRKLAWYHDHAAFPVKVEIVKRGESANGFDILDIDKAG